MKTTTEKTCKRRTHRPVPTDALAADELTLEEKVFLAQLRHLSPEVRHVFEVVVLYVTYPGANRDRWGRFRKVPSVKEHTRECLTMIRDLPEMQHRDEQEVITAWFGFLERQA